MRVEIECTEKQRLFLHYILEDKYVESVGFGGARGGSKTFSSCLAMILRRLELPDTRGLMLRRIQKAADQNLGEEIKKILKMLGIPVGSAGVIYNKQEKRFYFPNNSYINIGYCRTDNDWEQYQGLAYTDIAFEEAAQFPEDAWTNIIGSNRLNTRGLNATPKVWATCNPGGIGNEWVMRRFGVKDPKTADKNSVFIQSLLKESKALLEQDPAYRDRVLAKQPDWRRKQWEDGDWESFEGAFFNFDKSKVFVEQEIPYWAEIVAGVDEGYYPSAFACVWAAQWKDEATGLKRTHVFRELKRHKLGFMEQAKEALSLESYIDDFTVSLRYADPSCWKKDGGSVCSMSWLENGFVVVPAASNARSPGWNLMRDLIDRGVLTIDPSCYALISEIENAVHDEKTDDIHPRCEDHVLDAFRYLLVSTIFSLSEKKETDPYKRRKKARNDIRLKRMERANN